MKATKVTIEYYLPILTTPEGLDIWNPNDSNAREFLAKSEEIVTRINNHTIDAIVLPFGWNLEIHEMKAEFPFEMVKDKSVGELVDELTIKDKP